MFVLVAPQEVVQKFLALFLVKEHHDLVPVWRPVFCESWFRHGHAGSGFCLIRVNKRTAKTPPVKDQDRHNILLQM